MYKILYTDVQRKKNNPMAFDISNLFLVISPYHRNVLIENNYKLYLKIMSWKTYRPIIYRKLCIFHFASKLPLNRVLHTSEILWATTSFFNLCIYTYCSNLIRLHFMYSCVSYTYLKLLQDYYYYYYMASKQAILEVSKTLTVTRHLLFYYLWIPLPFLQFNQVMVELLYNAELF